MLDFIKKFINEGARRYKISASLREHYRLHGNSRKVPVKEMGEVVGYIYLDKRPSFTSAADLRKEVNRI